MSPVITALGSTKILLKSSTVRLIPIPSMMIPNAIGRNTVVSKLDSIVYDLFLFQTL
ncbi:hypothetical protein LEP1GSC132_3362 [Leptospira kirschneri str. 200803703]|uniref:Uncharacterized protein n=1 Tax=Leptospira kirschneri str. 200802841 TaxID=1193047 RepID=A0A828XTR1_9LEPT|nr:hypothetical protein LEP1GSC131_0731 [Leptospira kirschneri str. 200802841]EKP03917.1 hypothetical protein LEP1GSC018_0718 [Leptospira kirschneri str. 2008720114]EKQ83834.1 hypothetical protein LEP1GSC064_3642 [Leptospira kirschneri serovar Grippotyphosa str. Moskva]EMJ86068.1 hypothetical protein LEP1GSC198_0256 [Leptospira kirschneri str. JB]EMO67360.1 hypothetical protein LEP1GSC132_3362 [Leptospira kirschneri str. 200803703]